MMDIVYFGYDHGKEGLDAYELQKQFIDNAKSVFPDIELRDAYDHIKGYRQEVRYEDNQRDDYLSWLIGDGWIDASLSLQLMMSEDKIDDFKRILAIAREQYPQAFKK